MFKREGSLYVPAENGVGSMSAGFGSAKRGNPLSNAILYADARDVALGSVSSIPNQVFGGGTITQASIPNRPTCSNVWSDGDRAIVHVAASGQYLLAPDVLRAVLPGSSASTIWYGKLNAPVGDSTVICGSGVGGHSEAASTFYAQSTLHLSNFRRNDASVITSVIGPFWTSVSESFIAFIRDVSGNTLRIISNGLSIVGSPVDIAGSQVMSVGSIGAFVYAGNPVNLLNAAWRTLGITTDIISDVQYNFLAKAITGNSFFNVIFDGNSLTAGQGSTGGLTYPNQTLASLKYHYSGPNDGIGGQTTPMMLAALNNANHPGTQILVSPIGNVVSAWEISNDIFANNVDGPTALAHWASYVAATRALGTKVVSGTVIARSEFTPTNQTAADYASKPELQNYSNPIYFSDGIHLTNTGYAVVASVAAPCIQAAGTLL
jgi:hypothetical protein